MADNKPFAKPAVCCLVLAALAFSVCNRETPAERLRRNALHRLEEEIDIQRRLTDPEKRALALSQSATTWSVFQRDAFMDSVFQDAYWSGCGVKPLNRQYHVLSQILGGMQIADLHERAFELAGSHSDTWLRGKLLCGVALRLDDRTDVEFSTVIRLALASAESDTNLIHRNETRICAARAFLKKGDDRQALQLAKLAETEALTIKNVWFTPTPDRYGYGTARYLFDALVYVYAKAGRKDMAIRFIRSLGDEKMRMDLESHLHRYTRNQHAGIETNE